MLAAAVFGEQRKLEPMAPDRKGRWKKEVGWLLSVADHIVEFVAKKQVLDNGVEMEVPSHLHHLVSPVRSSNLLNSNYSASADCR